MFRLKKFGNRFFVEFKQIGAQIKNDGFRVFGVREVFNRKNRPIVVYARRLRRATRSKSLTHRVNHRESRGLRNENNIKLLTRCQCSHSVPVQYIMVTTVSMEYRSARRRRRRVYTIIIVGCFVLVRQRFG